MSRQIQQETDQQTNPKRTRSQETDQQTNRERARSQETDQQTNRETEKEPALDEVRISVRDLVEFILRSGDIDQRTGQGGDTQTMQLGSRLHRKIQSRMGGDYQAEVTLSVIFPCDDFLIRVEGRADGIFREDDQVTVDEIKGVLKTLDHVEEPVPVHLAQAKCYAYMYAREKGLSQIGVRMSYGNLETEEMKYFSFCYSFEELQEWFLSVLEEYRKWARLSRNWKKTRQESIHLTTFPFPYREGQKKLAQDVYRTIARQKILFIQAPTGAGKTLSTVFPAVKAMGEGMGDMLFYLTAKTIARTVAAQALDQLRGTGLRFKSVVLTAKEKICPCEKAECIPSVCPYAKGHYDRINNALFTLISEKDSFTRDVIEEAADHYRVCPFELSLDLSVWMDAVICDYNYVFHPRSKLRRFFGENVRGNYLFLIDEAHNLVDRGRSMYSAQLIREDFLALKKEVKPFSTRLTSSLERCSRRMLEMKKSFPEQEENYRQVGELGTFPVLLMNLSGIIEDVLDDQRQEEAPGFRDIRDHVLDFYFQIITFLNTCDLLDENYVIYQEMLPDGRFMVRLFCVNPSRNLQSCMDRARSSVLFSATLLPIDYYRSFLTTKTDCYAVYASTCFDSLRLKVAIGTDISSRYSMRSDEQYRKIADYIRQVILARKGNYMVFFPSYRMLETEELFFRAVMPQEYRLICQSSGMKEVQREEFLAAFSEKEEKGTVGFCVMGSIFGEGIDLKNDRLIGAVIVGTGLPQVCTEQELLLSCLNREDPDRRNGYRYAYLCPGMNRVLQAAGRVIRTEEDRGVVVLLDDRFTRQEYRDMFPREWSNITICRQNSVRDCLEKFWEQ